ncbi:50S ribosomal protein L5 [Candidatus Sumerlaeota bacterium]|nr:50S ribosomal protein L5 [Candidatus Sumerlaeota bacterium]
MPRLLERYRAEIVPAMMKRFGYKNAMQAPRLEKIVINMGIGEASRDIKLLDSAEKEMALIAGQKAVATRAARAISAFKIRAGMPVGCFVTLRGRRMYDFLDRLINVAIPRVRDFRGLAPKSFDGRGNHSMGIREHLIFMELDYNKVQTVRGMNITTVTTAKSDEEARELLRLFGMPFRQS